jgi:hypothetical protein
MLTRHKLFRLLKNLFKKLATGGVVYKGFGYVSACGVMGREIESRQVKGW